MSYKIITTSPVNIRKGAGIVFPVNKTVPAGTIYDADSITKDGGNVTWYHTSDGYVCGNYVSLSKDLLTEYNKSEDRISRVQSAIGEIGGSTVNVSDIQNTIQKGRNVQTSNTALGINSEAVLDEMGGINDIMLNRRVLGSHYQFLDTTDVRPTRGADKELGITMAETLSEAPIISVIPGKPFFLADLDDAGRTSFFKSMNTLLENPDNSYSILAQQNLEDANADIKFFTFKPDFVSFVRYFNTLCWMLAGFMGISNKPVPGVPSDDGNESNLYGRYNWARYTLANRFAGRTAKGLETVIQQGNGVNTEGVSAVAGDLAKAFDNLIHGNISAVEADVTSALDMLTKTMELEQFYTDFYINPNVSYSENFSNNTKDSMLAGMIQGASEYSKELGFLMGAGGLSADVAQSMNSYKKQADNMADKLLDGKGILSKLIHGASSVITGSNIAFPKMWMDSTFSKSYNIEINLKAAYGTRECIFTDILVPMSFWIALTAPKQNTVNTYSSPYLLRFFIPGYCSVDMGMVESLTISKGGDGSAWSVEGFPLEVNLSITIADLYSAFSLSRINGVSTIDAYNFISNTALIDYMGVYGGLNLRRSEWQKKKTVASLLIKNSASDMLGGHLSDTIGEWLATTKRDIFTRVIGAGAKALPF